MSFSFPVSCWSFDDQFLELTTEEEAVLDAPELSEKDLPEQELAGYLRSSKEMESLKRWMDSSTSDEEEANWLLSLSNTVPVKVLRIRHSLSASSFSLGTVVFSVLSH